MHAFSSTIRVLMLIGLGLTLAMATGCPSKPECETAADCEGEGDWLCTAEGVCEAVTVDPCEGVSCPGGQTCVDGACTGTCCETNTCVTQPGAICDEARCLAGAQPCVNRGCEPACTGDRICNLDTLECEVACLHLGCPLVNERCNATTGACEERAPTAGEIGYPCPLGENWPDPIADAECDDVCGPWGFCSKSCRTNSDCGAGAFCLSDMLSDGSGFCWAACDDFWGQDCARGLQCVVFDDLEYPGCYNYFDISDCETGCLGRGEICDPTVPDQCQADLACVDIWDDTHGICQQIQCGLPVGGCEAEGETCLGIGANLSICVDDCDITVLGGCPDGLSCTPQARIDSLYDLWALADSAANCPPQYPDSVAVGTDVLCYAGCADNSECRAGFFCDESELFSGVPAISGCVSYSVVEGGCDLCAEGLDCTVITGSGAAACYLGCETDADCNAETEKLGACNKLTFTSGDAMFICTYESQGSLCLFGCESTKDCNYCESDADCGLFQESSGGNLAMKCDYVSNTCKKPTTAIQASSRCYSSEVRDPEGITREDGTTEGACATACDEDLDCDGTCAASGFCIPKPTTCNVISGQCESLCQTGDTCIHDTCVNERCVVGCATGDDCGAEGECYTAEAINYCVIPECATAEDCEGELVCNEFGFCEEPPVVDLCLDVTCEGGLVCDPATGDCVDLCLDVTCEGGLVCDPATGGCVDLCLDVACDAGFACNYLTGECEAVN